MNAANAVVCPADWETFGLACVEALACDVPVLARPTGVHAEALRGIAGPTVRRMGPARRGARRSRRTSRRPIRASPGALARCAYSADALAARVATAWRWLVSGGPPPPLYSPAEARTGSSFGAPSS